MIKIVEDLRCNSGVQVTGPIRQEEAISDELQSATP